MRNESQNPLPNLLGSKYNRYPFSAGCAVLSRKKVFAQTLSSRIRVFISTATPKATRLEFSWNFHPFALTENSFLCHCFIPLAFYHFFFFFGRPHRFFLNLSTTSKFISSYT